MSLNTYLAIYISLKHMIFYHFEHIIVVIICINIPNSVNYIHVSKKRLIRNLQLSDKLFFYIISKICTIHMITNCNKKIKADYLKNTLFWYFWCISYNLKGIFVNNRLKSNHPDFTIHFPFENPNYPIILCMCIMN